MAKLTLTDITSGYASTTQLNANFAAIETALENTVSRDGTTPNTMSADLDMNGNTILNLADIDINGVSIAQLAIDADDAALSAASAYISEVNAAASASSAAITAGALVDLEYKGNWADATLYKVNNIVYYATDGASYICTVEHTSSGTLDVTKFGLLAIQGAAGAGTGDMLKSENLSGLANYTTARSNMGLTIGTHVQAYDALLQSLAGQTTAADRIQAYSGVDTATLLTVGSASGNVPLVSNIVGTQTVWIPAGAMTTRTTNGAAAGTAETTTNKVMIKTLDFDTAADEHAQFSIRMPKGWDEGTLTFTPVWSHPATTTNFGVVWFLQAVAVSNDDTLEVAFGTAVSSTDTGGTTNNVYVGPASAAMTVAGTPAEGDLVVFQIYRDVSDAGDTLAVDARLHGVTINYTTNALNDN